MFITAVEQQPQTEPQTALLRTVEGADGTIQSPLVHAESTDTVSYPRRKLAARSAHPMSKSGPFGNSKTRQVDKAVTGLSFERMTMRELDKVDIQYNAKNDLKSPNIYNGNKALRGLSLNDKRFDNIEKNPKVSSNIKNTNLPKWELNSDRQIDFRNIVYNRNIYKPKTSMVNRRAEVGHALMDKKIGRNE